MSVRDKIRERLDALEFGLKEGRHLRDAEGQSEMADLAASVAKFYTVLDDGDRDFVNTARHAISGKISWK